jgi:hypothetical protein
MRSFLLLVLAAGCSSPPPPPAGDILVTPTEYDAVAMTQTALADGDPIDLVNPPQGGFVLFVGAIVRNLSQTTVALHAALQDPSGTTLAEDSRTVSFVASPGDPGAFVPDLRSFTGVANVAVCPNASSTDRYNQPFQLEVDVTEAATGRRGSATVGVTPSCRQTDTVKLTLCYCECSANFMVGKCAGM